MSEGTDDTDQVIRQIESKKEPVTVMVSWIEQFRRDVQFGVRGLVRSPGFALLSIVSLALGIMATTAIYSVLHAVVLDPFPYKDVDNLMSVRVSNAAQRGFRTGYSVDQFVEIAERSQIFEGVIASTISDVLWTGDGDPQRLRGNHGTFNTFDVMGVLPLIGRTPSADDARAGAEPVVVLGYRFWQRQFGGDAAVLGRRLNLNDTARTVIGVMPKRFMWRGADVYLPIRFERGRIAEGVRNVHLLGRLKPGITGAQAEADLAPIIADLKTREPLQFPDQWRVGVQSFEETFPSAIARDVWVLLGAVGLLLVIACANVSNLLLSRASARQREMTVRAALGAGRGRLVRQMLTESLILSLAAGALGTVLAYAGLPAILSLVPPDTIPDEAEISLNATVLVFALLVSAATSILCGLAPALHSSRRDLAVSMREAGRGLAGGSSQAVLRKTLVVAEVALSLMLLAGSSGLLRAFLAMQQVDLGVAPERVLTMRVPLPQQRYPDATRRIAFFQELLERVRSVPGVAAAAVNSGLHPLGNMAAVVEIPGAAATGERSLIHNVSADYPATAGIRLAEGRLLTDSDVTGSQPVALVNERFVRLRLGGTQAIGQMIRIPRLKEPPLLAANDSFQIVGVVRDTPNAGIAEPVVPEVYVPYTAAANANLLIVRTHGDPAGVTRPVVSQVYAVDKGQPVTSVMTLEAILRDDEYATPRFNLILLSVFAAVGLALAIIGVYGVMSSAVAQERQEIGIRMALGADAGTIARMVILRGSRLLLAGTVLGLAGSVVAGRLLAQEVWRVSGFDPIAFAAVAMILIAVGVFACAWPARRAMRVDPIVALRHD
jgi:putative ABC transport system permease protein